MSQKKKKSLPPESQTFVTQEASDEQKKKSSLNIPLTAPLRYINFLSRLPGAT